jgi:putative ABC transport system ATP-binding protein
LSGGESQRVAIARALANRPRLVLADEPTGNLDDESARLVLDLLASLPAEHACTLVVVTHNDLVASRADRVVRLDAGHLTEVR